MYPQWRNQDYKYIFHNLFNKGDFHCQISSFKMSSKFIRCFHQFDSPILSTNVHPTFHNTRLFLHFPNELCDGYLRFEGTKLRQPTGQTFSLPSQRNFPISFKPKVAIAEFFWKMQRKTWYSILGVPCLFPSKTFC